MEKRDLTRLFKPRSIAVIGASRKKGKVGHDILKNLIDFGYEGKLYPINPAATKIFGLDTYKDVKDVKGKIDLAVFAIPNRFVPNVLETCGQKGVNSAIIISAGFKESGAEGAKLEAQVVDIIRKYRMNVLGPNCLGLITTANAMNASFAAEMPPKGNIAFFSQSGALGTAILDWALKEEIGFSKFISFGNKADINESDLLEAMEDDAETKVILGYIEDVKNGTRFLESAKRISRKKPIIITKSGGTKSGARAASSHTGSLAGSDKAFEACFKQSGVIRARSIESLFDFARAFSYQPLPKGNNVVVLTNAGGPGIMAADAVDNSKVLNLASLTKESVDALRAVLPSGASVYNPVDILGDADMLRYKNALDIVMQDKNVDGVITILTPQAMSEIKETAEVIAKAQKYKKPIFSCFMGGKVIEKGLHVLRDKKVPNYSFPERAVSALTEMVNFARRLESPKEKTVSFEVDRQKVAKILGQVKDKQYNTLPEYLARDILSSYGFKLPKSLLAESAKDAVEKAKQIGFPVVMKIASPDVIHKSDVGGVKVNLRDEMAVEQAFYEMTERTKRIMPKALILGVMVQEMITQGREVILGMAKDSQFGPLVMFGLGGVYVEVLKDVSFRIAPLTDGDAASMIKEINSYTLLKGVRGEEAVDIDAIKDGLLRLSQLVIDFPQILELDINPMKVMPISMGGSFAVDVRITLEVQ